MGGLLRRILACAHAATAAPGRRLPSPGRALRRPARRGMAAVAITAALAGTHASLLASGSPYPTIVNPGSRAAAVIAAEAAAAGIAKGRATAASAAGAAAYRRIILPDLLVVAPQGLTSRQIARLRKITGFMSMITFDGAEIRAAGRPASVIGVDPRQFRSWVPLRTASDQALWAALSAGQLVASDAARTRLGLRAGRGYTLRAGTARTVRFGAAAQLGVSGVDLLVNPQLSRALGLVHTVAALISAPGVSLPALLTEVSRVLGPSGRIVTLRKQQLPVATVAPGQVPTTYLQLFRASAARYCPRLSWTVLAAIGQIESGDGANVGPSSAGALGPMQFLPSTWAIWGTDGFGQTGPPDIMNPYDAVPAAARLLCAAGAAGGGQALYGAIFAYNHADWYVREVLALAAEYAANYR